MGLTDLIPWWARWLLLAALAAALVAFGFVKGSAHAHAQADAVMAKHLEQDHREEVARAEKVIQKQHADALETQRRMEHQERNQHAKDERDAAMARDAAAARAAADGLRGAAAAYLAAAGCDGRTGDAAAECIRAATEKVGDVLGQCAARYSDMAAAADDARSRGLKCEADYDALRPPARAENGP